MYSMKYEGPYQTKFSCMLKIESDDVKVCIDSRRLLSYLLAILVLGNWTVGHIAKLLEGDVSVRNWARLGEGRSRVMDGLTGNMKILKKRWKSVEIVAIVVGVLPSSHSHWECVRDMSRTYLRLWEYAGCHCRVLVLIKRESQRDKKERTKQRSRHLSHRWRECSVR